MEPLAKGDYPNSMKSLVKGRLPTFSKEQSVMLNGSFDFLGLNYYTTYYARNVAHTNATNPSYITDSQTQTTRKSKIVIPFSFYSLVQGIIFVNEVKSRRFR